MEGDYAAIQGEKDKYNNYKDLVNENYYIVTIAHETMGSWAQDSLKFMKDLESRVSEATGEKMCQVFPVPKYEHESTKRKCPMCNGNDSLPQKTGIYLQSRNNFDKKNCLKPNFFIIFVIIS